MGETKPFKTLNQLNHLLHKVIHSFKALAGDTFWSEQFTNILLKVYYLLNAIHKSFNTSKYEASEKYVLILINCRACIVCFMESLVN